MRRYGIRISPGLRRAAAKYVASLSAEERETLIASQRNCLSDGETDENDDPFSLPEEVVEETPSSDGAQE